MLDRLPVARPGAVGAVGFSNGGFFSVLLAAQRQVKAGVAYYGALVGVAQPRQANPFLQSYTSASAPVLLLAGESDTAMGTWPVRRLEEIIKSVHAPYELIMYPDAEHRLRPQQPAPGQRRRRADAWTRTLAFLRAHLR